MCSQYFPDKARRTARVPFLLALCFCLHVIDTEAAAENGADYDWAKDPVERAARLRRLTQARLTEIGQSGGFSSRFVQEFAQDDQGFIWAATRNGLDRFDGYSVSNFRHDPAASNGLSSSEIMLIATGANGIVWTGSRAAGIDRFDSVTGKVINFRNLPGDPRDIGDDHIVDIIVGRAGDVWAATRASGLARINGQTLEVTRFHASAEGDHRIPGDAMNFVFEDASGRIWAGTDQGLVASSGPGERFQAPLQCQ